MELELGKLQFKNVSLLDGDKDSKVTVILGPADHYATTLSVIQGRKKLFELKFKTVEIRDIARVITRHLRDVVRFTASTLRAARSR